MKTHINYARLREINNDLATGRKDVERDGGHFCNDCQHITEVDCEGYQSKCVICGSTNLKVLDPIEKSAEPAAVSVVHRPGPKCRRTGERWVPVNEGHARFEAMLKALG